MSTWGKKEIKVDKYVDSPTLYYDYNTTSDSYRFIQRGTDEYTGLPYEASDFFGQDIGRAMMEAFIAHTLSFEGYCEEGFIERYVKNNRFRGKE